MLTAAQAAEYACISLSLIYQLCEERRLPHMRVGGKGKRGCIRIRREDLDAFLASIRIEARSK